MPPNWVLSQKRSLVFYGDERLRTGQENVKSTLRTPRNNQEVELKIRQALNIAGMKAAPPVTAPQESSTAKMNKETKQAMTCACKLLTTRRRTRRELEVHLGRKGFSSEVISLVLEKLEHYGYLDDKTFARLWVEQRLAKEPGQIKKRIKGKGCGTRVFLKLCQSGARS